jgi:hypothetical protein
MTNEERELVDRWILAFCEPPPVVDAELMRRLLAEPLLPKETPP